MAGQREARTQISAQCPAAPRADVGTIVRIAEVSRGMLVECQDWRLGGIRLGVSPVAVEGQGQTQVVAALDERQVEVAEVSQDDLNFGWCNIVTVLLA